MHSTPVSSAFLSVGALATSVQRVFIYTESSIASKIQMHRSTVNIPLRLGVLEFYCRLFHPKSKHLHPMHVSRLINYETRHQKGCAKASYSKINDISLVSCGANASHPAQDQAMKRRKIERGKRPCEGHKE